MTIAEITTYPGRSVKHTKTGGVASYAKNLFQGMPFTAEDTVYILCDKQDGSERIYQEDGMIIIRTFDRNYRYIRQLLREIRRLNPDVIHIQQEVSLYGRLHTAYLLQWFVRALRKKPVIVTLHHVVDLTQVNKKFTRDNNSKLPAWFVRLAFQIIYRPLIRWAHTVLVHEQYFKDLLIDQYGASAGKIQIIPHGVEDFQSLDTAKARKQLGVQNDRKVALFMGYLAGYKGFDLLLEGFGLYVKRDPKALLLIGAGKHPKLLNDQAYLKTYNDKQKKAAKLIPKEQYRWIGFIDEQEAPYYYSASDVSLFPYTISLSSSGPMSFAIGYEKPFLASDAFEKVLSKTVLFERSAEAMADKLASFFADPKPYARISANMKKDRLWTKVGKQTLLTYKKVRS